MPIPKTLDEIVNIYKLLLVDFLNARTGAAWKIEHVADKWNLLLKFDFVSDSPDYAAASKQICSSDFVDGVETLGNEIISWSKKRAVALKEIGIGPESPLW